MAKKATKMKKVSNKKLNSQRLNVIIFSNKLIILKERPRSFVLSGKFHHKIYNFYSNYRPKSTEVTDIINIFDAGMSMARLNLSHGTLKQNLKLLNKFK